jgi:hypothetical protein
LISGNRKNADAQATVQWNLKRGDARENRIKDLKSGFGMEYMPCGTFQADAAFFAVGVSAYSFYLGFRGVALGKKWAHSHIQTVRGRLVQTAGNVVRHGTGVFENQRRHAGCVYGDQRALRASHAGRRRSSRNVVTLTDYAFNFALFRTEHEPSSA